MISKTDIERACLAIRSHIVRTPTIHSQTLSRLCGCRLLFKLENFQMTGSFKDRGALNRLLALSPAEKERGVMAASAGNHAQAVAYHCHRLGLQAKIVMPVNSPLIKVLSTQNYGAQVILHGETVTEAMDLAWEISRKENLTFIHPFDDPLVIAGQGTILPEILEEESARDLEAIVCPIGGGGLISGMATYLKETHPRIQLIGVVAAACPAMKNTLREKTLVQLDSCASLADGIAVKKVSPRTLAIVQKYVDEVVEVEEDEIANAILLLLEIEKVVAEGAGAVSLAALLNRKVHLEGKKVLAVISGGNIDVNILDRIITRGLAVEGRAVRVTVRLKDLPGSLMGALGIIKKLHANVLDILHHRHDSPAPFGYVDVSITLETRGHAHIAEIKKALEEGGYLVCESQCFPPKPKL